MKALLLLLALISLPSSLLAGDFDNWFFDFMTGRCEVEGEMLDAENKQIGTFVGVTKGAISADGKKFTVKFEYTYMPQGVKAADSCTYTKHKDGVYRAAGVDPDGVKYKIELKIEEDKTATNKSTKADGRMVHSILALKKDGAIHATDTLNFKGLGVVSRINYKWHKVKLEPNAP